MFNKSEPFSLKLRSQGLYLVVAFLLMELAFLGAFWRLLVITENEARREESSKQNLASLQKLLRLVYDAGVAFEFYTSNPDAEHKERLLSDVSQSRSMLQSIMEHTRDSHNPNERAESDLASMSRGFEQTAAMVNEVIQITEKQPTDSAAADVENVKKKLHVIQLDVVAHSSDLLKTETQVALDSPIAQRRARENLKTLLIAALPLNVALAILMALFFTRSITSRLDVLVDNTRRLRKRLPLNSTLLGNDEISQLDLTFHEMADALLKDENLLKASEARVRKMIDFMPIGLIVLGADGQIQFVNPRVEQMFGYEANTLIKMALRDLFAPKAGASLAMLLEALSGATESTNELDALRKGGQVFPVEISITSFTSGTDNRKLVTIMDVTARQEVQKLRQAFVAMVSHELRAPLTSIRGFFSLLDIGAYGQLSAEALEGANRAETNTVRLMTLINDLLDLEKIESGMFSISAKRTPLKPILINALDSVKESANEKGVRLQLRTADENVYADADRLLQVLINLLSNAIKFSNPGDQVELESALITRESSLAIRVIDHGRGIPDSHKFAIFERFQQVEQADSTKRGGSGLGLPISKAIVEKHGGTLHVESEWGKGSTFVVRLPLASTST
jgi:PAS domain S-box-containing protein